jgi:hypothetical protein
MNTSDFNGITELTEFFMKKRQAMELRRQVRSQMEFGNEGNPNLFRQFR